MTNFIEDMHKRQAAIRRALAAYGLPQDINSNIGFMLDAFARGEFNEPPLPKAIVPPFAVKVGFYSGSDGQWQVDASDSKANGWIARGPMMPTKKEAIEVWNLLWRLVMTDLPK